MKIRKDTQSKILKYIIVVLMCLGVLYLWETRYMYTGLHTKESEIAFLNSGWYLVTETGEISCKLPYTAEAGEGEKVILQRDITQEDWNQWILLSTLNEFLTVYGDDEPIYEQENCYSPKYGSVPGGGRHYICIPEGISQLRLEVYSPYFNGKIRYSHIVAADSEGTLMQAYQAAYIYHFMVDIMMIIAGAALSLQGIVMYVQGEHRNLLLRLGMLMIAVGVWLRTGTTNLDMYLWTAGAQRHISYLSFLLIPFCASGMMKCYFMDKYRKYQIWQRICLLMTAVYYGMYFTGIFELPEMLPVVHLIFIMLGISFLCDNFRMLSKDRKMKRDVRMLAMMLILLAGALELFEFYYNRNRMPDGFWLRVGIVLGITLLAVEEVGDRHRRKLEELQAQEEEKELRLQVTLSQLQPHFLFNALGAIRIMIRMNAEAAYDMLYDFSGFLRSCIINLQEQKTIPFDKEMNQIRNYLNIERIRFNDRIRVAYELETEEFDIPPLTIEPLVVNAVQHGLRKGKDGGTVTIRTRQEGEHIIVEVADDGVGFDVDAWNREHPFTEQYKSGQTSYIGLENVRSRLYHQARAVMKMESRPMIGTTITVIFPLGRIKNNNIDSNEA